MSHKAFSFVIEQLPFPLKVDMFASKYFFKLSQYVSRYIYHSAWKVDAFSFPWPNNIYVFPPLSQISCKWNLIPSDQQNLVRWSRRYCIYYPAWKSLSILPSLLDLLIDDHIIISLHQLVERLPTRHPFIVTVWFHFSLLCKISGIPKPTRQALFESIDPKKKNSQ